MKNSSITNSPFLSSKIQPPSIENVSKCLKIPPEKRNSEQNQIIFRHLLLNEKIISIFEKSSTVEQIIKNSTSIILKKGDVLFFEGDDPDYWYLIVKGSVDIIIRLFLVAQDCLFDADAIGESTEFAPLMDKMGLNVSNDKLHRVSTLFSGEIFGYHSLILNRKRMSTIISSSDVTELIKFPLSTFRDFGLLKQQNLFQDHTILLKKVLFRLREDQISLISIFSKNLILKPGTNITSETSFGNNLYIIKSGIVARYQIVDFTPLSFRTIPNSLETLTLKFPNGFKPVHIDNISIGTLFSDPSIEEFNGSKFNAKTKTDVELLVFDLNYFRIIVGEFELERIKQETKCNLNDDQVIQVWIDSEKKRLWEKFKLKTIKDAHTEMKGDKLFKTGKFGLRIPKQPKSIKTFIPKKKNIYVPKHLTEKKYFGESQEY